MASKMYTEFAHEYDEAITSNIYNGEYERPSLMRLLPDVDGKTVLDLGCGPGVYAQDLASKGARITALDASKEMVAITQKKLGNAHHCYQHDLQLGLPQEHSQAFDVVICPLTIHYLLDLQPLFDDIARVLKKGGIFAFSTHHPIVDFADSPSGRYYDTELITQQWNTLGRPETVSYYRRPLSDVTSAISQANMVIEQLTEGHVPESLKSRSEHYYERLTSRPTFLFYRCRHV